MSGSADISQRAAHVLRSSVASARGGPRDAAVTLDGVSDLLSGTNAAGSGSSTARDTGSTPRTAAASAAATPRFGQTNQLLDYGMFEQLWLSDLSYSPGK